MPTVYKTEDYGIFTKIVGNRQLNAKHVKDLIDSIRIKNMLEDKPMNVIPNKSDGKDNGTFAILDGQHRLEAAQTMGLPIYYTVSQSGGLDEVHLLQRQRVWITADYLESYIAKGVQDYQILKDFCQEYGLTTPIGVQLLVADSTGKHWAMWETFKTGKFVVDNLMQGNERAKALMELKPYTEFNVWRTRNFVYALKQVWDKMSPESFQAKVVEKGAKFGRRVSVNDYLRDFEETANYRVKVNHVRFF